MDDLGWLALADHYLAEVAKAEQDAQHDPEPPRARQPRKIKPSSDKLALVDRDVAKAEARVVRQEAVVDRLVQDKRDATFAQEVLHLMRQVLDRRRERRKAFLDRLKPEQQVPPPDMPGEP